MIIVEIKYDFILCCFKKIFILFRFHSIDDIQLSNKLTCFFQILNYGIHEKTNLWLIRLRDLISLYEFEAKNMRVIITQNIVSKMELCGTTADKV